MLTHLGSPLLLPLPPGARHPGVTSLSLTSASISAGGFFALGGLAGLRSLAISFAEPLNMEGGCGASLRRLTQLTRLALHSQSLRHDELLLAEYISGLSNLQVGLRAGAAMHAWMRQQCTGAYMSVLWPRQVFSVCHACASPGCLHDASSLSAAALVRSCLLCCWRALLC
jgi:hypothetical protein